MGIESRIKAVRSMLRPLTAESAQIVTSFETGDVHPWPNIKLSRKQLRRAKRLLGIEPAYKPTPKATP